MVSVCLSSDALLQHLPSYSGFSYLVRGVSLQGCSSKPQLLLLTLEEGSALLDLQCGIALLGPPVPVQPPLLGSGFAPPSCSPWPRVWGGSSQPLSLASDAGYLHTTALPDLQHGMASLGPPAATQPRHLGRGVAPPGRPWTWTRGSSSWPFLHRRSLALLAAAPDLGLGVTPLGRHPSGMGSSWLLPLTSDVG